MIIIRVKQTQHEFRYEGQIELSLDNVFLNIDWYIDEMPPQDFDELCVWRSNGFDKFFIEDIISITSE